MAVSDCGAASVVKGGGEIWEAEILGVTTLWERAALVCPSTVVVRSVDGDVRADDALG